MMVMGRPVIVIARTIAYAAQITGSGCYARRFVIANLAHYPFPWVSHCILCVCQDFILWLSGGSGVVQWHNKLNLIMKEETKQRRNENLNNYTFVLVTQSHLFCIWFSHFPHFSSKHSLFHSNPTHVSLRLAPTPTFPRIYRIPVEWVNCMAMQMYEMEKEKLYWKRITIILQHFLLPFQLFLRNKTCNILANVSCFCMFNRFNGACCILCDDVSEFVFLFCCLRWLYPECGCVCVE